MYIYIYIYIYIYVLYIFIYSHTYIQFYNYIINMCKIFFILRSPTKHRNQIKAHCKQQLF